MANNFRILTKDYYISPNGHDANDGLTPDTPIKTLGQLPTTYAATGNVVFGAGTYQIAGNYSDSKDGDWFADGVVNVLGDGSNTFKTGGNSTGNKRTMYDFIIENWLSYQQNGTLSNGTHMERCKVKDVVTFSFICRPTYASNFKYNIIVNVDNCNLRGGGNPNIYNNVFINCLEIYNAEYAEAWIKGEFYNNYVDQASNIKIETPGDFYNNNIQGTLQFEAIKYAIQDQLTGTPQDNGYAVGVEWLTEANLTANGYLGTVIGWDVAVATCMNRDPLFNNAAREDFSLQDTSPHIGAGSDGTNIGGTDVAITKYVGIDAEIDAPDSRTNLVGTNELSVDAGDSGTLRTAPIAITPDANPRMISGKIDYIGTLYFDKLVAGGTASQNKDVPDSNLFTGAVAGANPDRLSYKMRWSMSATAPTQDAHWDNGGLVSEGVFTDFEWNQTPLVDSNGVGNGNPGYDNINSRFKVTARYIQIEVTLRNNFTD